MAAKLVLLAVAFSVMMVTSSAFGGLRRLQQVSSDESCGSDDPAVTNLHQKALSSLIQLFHFT